MENSIKVGGRVRHRTNFPCHTFINSFTNHNPKMQFFLFLDSAQAGLLENVHYYFFRHHGSWEIAKPKCTSTNHGFHDLMHAYFCFCDFSGSKMPRKMVLNIFQKPSLCRIQKYNFFYSMGKIDGSIDKTIAWYHVMKCNHVIRWYQLTVLFLHLPI